MGYKTDENGKRKKRELTEVEKEKLISRLNKNNKTLF